MSIRAIFPIAVLSVFLLSSVLGDEVMPRDILCRYRVNILARKWPVSRFVPIHHQVFRPKLLLEFFRIVLVYLDLSPILQFIATFSVWVCVDKILRDPHVRISHMLTWDTTFDALTIVHEILEPVD